MDKTRKVKHSFGTYIQSKTEPMCDVEEVAKVLSNWGDIPKSLNDARAFEISLLAKHYLALLDKVNHETK